MQASLAVQVCLGIQLPGSQPNDDTLLGKTLRRIYRFVSATREETGKEYQDLDAHMFHHIRNFS